MFSKPYRLNPLDEVEYSINLRNLSGLSLINAFRKAFSDPRFSKNYCLEVSIPLELPTRYASSALEFASSAFIERHFIHPELGPLENLSNDFRSLRISSHPKKRIWTAETFLSLSNSYNSLDFCFYSGDGFYPSPSSRIIGVTRTKPIDRNNSLFYKAKWELGTIATYVNNVLEDNIRDVLKTVIVQKETDVQ